MQIPKRHPENITTANPKSGFALVIALSLMAFVLLLLLSMTTLVRVESQSSEIKQSTLLAQQNALLGLQIGLGRLQSSVGRDRVATGTIEVDSNLAVDPTKRYWTGTWNNPGSYDAVRNLKDYNVAELTNVLVPEVEGSTLADLIGTLSTPADQTWPILLGAPTVDTVATPTQIVRAPAIDIDSPDAFTQNRYSYWVADEGIKARVDLSDPAALPASDLRQQDADSVVRLLSPPRTGSEQMRVDGTRVGADFPSDPNILSRIADTDALGLLFAGGENFAQSNFHDLTVHSTGLFTDQRLGGLRQDLTWMLRDNKLPTGFLYKEPVSVSAGRHSRENPPGPAWNLIQKFYDTAATGPIPITHDFRLRRTDDPSDHPINLSPLVTQLKLYFNFAFGPAIGGSKPHGGHLRMYMFPVVVLNNPYNRPLAAEDYEFTFIQHNTDDSTELEVRTYNEFGDLVRRFGGASPGEGYKFKDFSNALFYPTSGSGSDNSGKIYFYAKDLAFEPGETIVLTLKNSGHYTGFLNNSLIVGNAHPGNSRNSDGNELAPGFNVSNSAYVEFADTLEADEDPQTFQFELINQGNIRFALGRKNIDGHLLLLTVNYEEFDYPTDLGIGSRLTRSDTTFAAAGFTYTMDLGNVPHLADFNPRSTNMSTIDNVYETGARPPRLYRGDFGIDEFTTDAIDPDTGAGYFGPSHTPSGFGRTVLFEIPQSSDEFVSLGQLKHLDLSVRNTGGSPLDLDEPTHHAPAYIFGNSRADPRVGTEVAFLDTSVTHRYGAAFDFSYRSNEALWDGFFFSTAPDVNGEPPLNRRITAKAQNWVSPTGPYDASENLSIEGAFNVNSVSVNAWRAVLSGLQDHELETVSAGTQNDTDFLFGSVVRPLDGAFNYSGQGASSTEVWNQSRSLEPDEINALATAIVTEVRERGPFLSLAHFVNRSLGSPSKLTEKGALQAAIDLAGGNGLNDGLGGSIILLEQWIDI